MAGSYQLIVSSDMIATLETLGTCRRLAASHASPAAIPIAELIVGLEAELSSLGGRTALLAEQKIKQALRQTARRPETQGQHVHLIDTIKAETIGLGAVEVAPIAELDKAVNPNGGSDKPYWRAQEYGLDEGFVGRRLFGTFEPSGQPPSGAPAGGGGFDPSFVMGTQEGAGPGQVQHPIIARHFLRSGTDAAIAYYSTRIRALERKWTPLIAEAAALAAVPV
jgi:hypothetical protein